MVQIRGADILVCQILNERQAGMPAPRQTVPLRCNCPSPMEKTVPHNVRDPRRFDRRSFVKASLIPAALPLAAALAKATALSAEPPPSSASSGPDIIDSNVHLFEWPFRKLKYDRTEGLVAKLRRHRITQAWAGSFEAVLHKQLDAINRR